jgi:hypothetical protein
VFDGKKTSLLLVLPKLGSRFCFAFFGEEKTIVLGPCGACGLEANETDWTPPNGPA